MYSTLAWLRKGVSLVAATIGPVRKGCTVRVWLGAILLVDGAYTRLGIPGQQCKDNQEEIQ
jgi:hypothetical protein